MLSSVAKLRDRLVDEAESMGTALRELTAMGIDRKLALQIEGAGQGLLPAEAPGGQAQVLVDDQFGGGETVMYLGQGQFGAGVADSGLPVGVFRRADDFRERGEVVVGVDDTTTGSRPPASR